ncbi:MULTISPECIES: TetR/AcrR family transcriptional regulator [Snodgrassella]|nr:MULTISPECIES: TetR/AcrR family transcriptional regulator [Snodgrassella]MBI0157721.1 TetR/AcrR family transcriptional regulator [Snodgrassella sp. W6238H11]MBI0160453.1 TetR/AcrR family transcriptional regulator [Snodgrassella sp. W6238H14]MBI0164470.1 TetR/AcrR family transcriptional regulator [Snodgrassella sp. M0351]MBI0181344.1 TetR/AcrR family transcriptional regulator [Snodgrassella sp. W8158]MCT6883221.1 TetR/AcrR family transcriptional regulator [Snodgrassella alvi]
MKKTYRLIADTAEQLFYQKGFGNVGVDEIRDQSGCSKTTLYKHFGNKDNLIFEVLKLRDLRFKQELTEAIADLDQQQSIIQILKWHLDWYNQDNFNGCLFVRAREEIHNDNAIKELVMEHKEFIRNLIRDKLRQNPQNEAITNQLMVILEGLSNISLIYKDNKLLYDEIIKNSFNWVSEILL